MLWSILCQTVSGKGPSLSVLWMRRGCVSKKKKGGGTVPLEEEHESFSQEFQPVSSWQSQLSIITFSCAHTFIFSFSHIISICPCFIPRISSSSSLTKTETRVGGVFIHAPPLSWRFESRHSSWNSSDPLLGWLQCFHYIRLELEWKRGGGAPDA